MDNFKFIYRILKTLEKAMDLPEFDISVISHESLGITKERWSRYMEMMSDIGLIKGVVIEEFIGGETSVDCSEIRITLKGLEYLTENGLMKKAFNLAKGIREIV